MSTDIPWLKLTNSDEYRYPMTETNMQHPHSK